METILIVEDEALVARHLQRKLEQMGYNTPYILSSGEEAIHLLQVFQPDLILMDIRLSGVLDGIKTIEQISAGKKVPHIYLTAHSDEETIERAKHTLPSGYLLKPIDMYQLRIAIQMALHIETMEKQAIRREQRHQSMFSAVMDAFVLLDISGQVIEVNQATCLLTGYKAEELLSMQWSDLETSRYWGDIARCMAMGSARYESIHRTQSGKPMQVETSLTYLAAQECIFVFIHDISDRKQTQEEILRLNLDMEKQLNENRQLYQKELAQRKLAETLSEAGQALISTLDIDVVLDRILQQVGKIVENDVCNIVLLDGERPQVVRTHGYETFDAGSFIEAFVFPLEGSTIQHYIIENCQPVVVSDVRQDHRWQLAEERIWLRSYVAAPITLQGKVIGLLNVGTSLPGFYNDDHGQLLTAFANTAAIAFQNARLFEEAQRVAQRMESLSHSLLEIQENERRYIARELHDEIGQTLTAVRIGLQSLRRESQAGALPHNRLDEIQKMLDLTLEQVRNMSLDLRPSMLDDLGLLPALRWFVEREAKWAGFEAHLVADENQPRLAAQVELVCFRIAQEALTNVVRHADAKEVRVELHFTEQACDLQVIDDGCGFDAPTVNKQITSLGLIGMYERAALVGGRLDIQSRPGKGTLIHAILPLRLETSPMERTV